ncbi:hypothetical protein ES708_24185 [subsurface metagenome]
MDNQFECVDTRYVDGGADRSTLIQKNAVKVHWISFFPESTATAGVIQMYDGFDNGGKLKWQHEPAYAGHKIFIPPFLCRQGLFIFTNAALGGYTIGYCPVSRDREQS